MSQKESSEKSKEDLQKEKEALELEKLRLDVKDMTKKWWVRPAYLSLMATPFMALLTFLIAMFTDYINFSEARVGYDQKREKLETEYNTLQDSVLVMEARIKQDSILNSKYKLLRYLEDNTLNSYMILRDTVDVNTQKDFLLKIHREHADAIYGEPTVVQSTALWRQTEDLFDSWSPQTSNVESFRKLSRLSKSYYKYRTSLKEE